MLVGNIVRGCTLSLCAAFCLCLFAAPAQGATQSASGLWTLVDNPPASAQRAEPWVRPTFFQGATIDVDVFRALVEQAPMEFSQGAFEDPVFIELPMPDGTFQLFALVESPVVHPDLGAKFPQIRTYSAQGIDDPTATARIDFGPLGFHSQILSAEGSFYIDPYSRNDTTFYAVYDKRDLRASGDDAWSCLGALDNGHLDPFAREQGSRAERASGTFLQTYRLALACTGEYSSFFGGSIVNSHNAFIVAINRVTGVYEKDLAIRLQIVPTNDNLIFLNSGADPYTNNNGSAMLSQNQTACDGGLMGTANYDIGHVFSTGGGGIAALGVACRAGLKAQGVTGLPNPTGDAFYIDYVAHEMGHQFGANHSFNGAASNCSGGNRNASTAYEPGSGSTIMSYAGICAGDNLQLNSDAYFVNISYDEIVAYTTGATGGCPANTVNGNTVPTVNAGSNFTIPRSTPFMLTAVASDADPADVLTYCWEQRNTSTPAAQSASGGAFPDLGNNPIIRSFNPTTNPSRIVPRLSNLLANTFVIGEGLPTTTRTLRFRCMVRDNRAGGGGVNFDDTDLSVKAAAGPFVVTAPNAGGTFTGPMTVTWNVAGTDVNLIDCANVKIELSTDGGNTWPTTLAASVPNDGAEIVILPAISTTTARIRVFAVGNIFFDISNTNFTISPPLLPGAFSLTSPADGATAVSLTPTLSWNASLAATGYTLTVDTDAGFALPNTYTTATASTSAAVPGATLANSTQYFWRVTATNGAGSTDGTPNPASFTTVPLPFCAGDANGDRAVDFADIGSVLSNFGNSYTPGSAGPGDADNDGIVNFGDVNTVLANFLVPCP